MPSSSGTVDGTQLVNEEEIQVVDCITDYPISELLNLKSSICQFVPQESVALEVCINTRVLPYEYCIATAIENTTVENVSDDDCPKATSHSLQFPLFSNNQLASKAKDSFEDRKKKGLLGGFNKKRKNLGFLRGGNS